MNGTDATEIVAFWRQAGPERWFAADPAFDETIRVRFAAAHIAASAGIDPGRTASADAALAYLLLTDQFPRNLYRNSAHAFATDPLARSMADRALALGFDMMVEAALRIFFYLPFQHHEDAASQMRAIELFVRHRRLTGDADGLRYARDHAGQIARFGRFPHRNGVLGRISTIEEVAFLTSGRG